MVRDSHPQNNYRAIDLMYPFAAAKSSGFVLPDSRAAAGLKHQRLELLGTQLHFVNPWRIAWPVETPVFL